jgi:hypothetical protein
LIQASFLQIVKLPFCYKAYRGVLIQKNKATLTLKKMCYAKEKKECMK